MMGIFRLVLALSVVMSHGVATLAGMPLINGAGAVLVFFSISGFLITLAINKKYTGRDQLRTFYWNRAIRLLPGYWAWLFITIVIYALLPSNWMLFQKVEIGGSEQALGFWTDWAGNASPLTLASAILANVTGLFADSFLYLSYDPHQGSLALANGTASPIWAMGFIFIAQFWSIGVELAFYAAAPFIVRSPLAIAIIFVLSITGIMEAAWVTSASFLELPAVIQAMKFPKYLWLFMIGALLAHLYMRHQANSDKRAIFALVVLFYLATLMMPGLFPMASFPAWLYLLLVTIIPIAFHLTRENPLDSFIGDISYPVYIVHFQIIQILGTFFGANGLLFAAASIVVAVVIVVAIERPSRTLKVGGRIANDRKRMRVVAP